MIAGGKKRSREISKAMIKGPEFLLGAWRWRGGGFEEGFKVLLTGQACIRCWWQGRQWQGRERAFKERRIKDNSQRQVWEAGLFVGRGGPYEV